MIPTLYEPFRHWSEGGSIFILSDLHFDDEDCKLMDPDWISPEEQLAIINKTVAKGDTFVCLGDVGNPKYVPMIKAKKKILLLGNHDARGAYKDLFDEVYTGPFSRVRLHKLLENQQILKTPIVRNGKQATVG